MSAKPNKAGASADAVVTKEQAARILFGDTEVMFSAFLNGKEDEYRFDFRVADLPWGEHAERLIAALAQMGARHVIYRAEKARKDSGMEPGIINAEMLGKAILSVVFAGDPVPNKDDVKMAKQGINAIAAGKVTWEKLEAKLKAAGFTLNSRDEKGLSEYFMAERLKKTNDLFSE